MHILSATSSYGSTVEPRNSRLLAALPAAVLQRWSPHLELVDIPAGTLLCRWNEAPSHVYFPTTASVSMLHTTPTGDSVEIVAVGSEGMVGIPVIMGGGSIPGEAVVQSGGQGLRVGSAWMQSEFHNAPSVMRLLLRYTQALMTHMAQSAICNQHHSLEQRLCRCFLSSLDRASAAPMTLTHESLACMLGVRREGVTCAALKLQRAGLIDYTRGRVAVLDRCALEALSCECYRVIKKEYDHFLSCSSSPEHVVAPRIDPPRQAPAHTGLLPRRGGHNVHTASGVMV